MAGAVKALASTLDVPAVEEGSTEQAALQLNAMLTLQLLLPLSSPPVESLHDELDINIRQCTSEKITVTLSLSQPCLALLGLMARSEHRLKDAGS